MARRKWNHNTIQQVLDGENPFIQVGYSKKYKSRKNGEIWADSKGNTWKQLSPGNKVRVNKQMDEIRELIRPRCQTCNLDINLFGTRSDEKTFAKTGKCFECLEIEEVTLRCTGKYDAYETKKLLKNKLSALKEFKKSCIDTIEYLKTDNCKMELVASNGEIASWTGAQNERVLKEATSDLEKSNKEIIDLEHAISQLSQ